MPPSPEVLATYRRRLDGYRARTSAGLVAAWDGLSDYRDDDLETFTTATAPLIAGAKVATVATSSAFFALTLGTRPAAVAAKAVDVAARIDNPFLAAWHALAEGRPFSEAIAAGRSQADAVGFDFVTSTARRTGDVVAKASNRTVRWERVPGGNSCDWCELVAGQTYTTAESADFGHDRCSCSVTVA